MPSKRFPNAAPWYEKLLFKTVNKWTAGWRRKPDFIIAGVQKGGTSSLYRYLEQHPDTKMPFRKQLHFFDRSWHRGFKHYQAAFPLRLFSKGKITGEATPYYFIHPRVAERIAQSLPDVKIILMFRNPISRAYSHYQMKKDQGWEPLATFEEAIEAEPGRIEPEWHKLQADPRYYSKTYRNFSYIQRGYYAQFLKEWYKHFPKDQILIMESNEFFADPMGNLRRVYAFLGLPDFQPPSLKAYNSREYQPINADTRQKLEEMFRPHNEALFELLGRRYDWD